MSSANRGYCFTGTVKGNGVNTLTDYDGNTITLPDKDIYLNTDHVGIVRTDAMMKKESGDWVLIEDKEERQEIKLIELISDKLSEGRVLFRVPGNRDNPEDYSLQYKGNARIAAYDAAGNIIWSWHIWVTDRPVNEGYSNGYVAMDRNLGAVTTDHNTYRKGISAWSGLYYQFGRKDPMFREPMESGNQWGGVDENTHPASSDSRVTVAEAHRHPMTYYYDGTGADGNWTTDSENSMNFWGYVSVRDDIVKTIYDPCPPGYRVPGNPIWENPSPDMTHQELTNGSGDFAGYNQLWGYSPSSGKVTMKTIYDPCPYGYRVPDDELEVLFSVCRAAMPGARYHETVNDGDGMGITVTMGNAYNFFPYTGWRGHDRGRTDKTHAWFYVGDLADYQDARVNKNQDDQEYYDHRGRLMLIQNSLFNGGSFTIQDAGTYNQQLTTDYANRTSAAPVRCIRYDAEP